MSMSCGLPYGHMPDDTPTGKEIYRVTEELKKRGHYTLREEIRAVSRVPIAFEPDHIGCTALAVNWQPG